MVLLDELCLWERTLKCQKISAIPTLYLSLHLLLENKDVKILDNVKNKKILLKVISTGYHLA